MKESDLMKLANDFTPEEYVNSKECKLSMETILKMVVIYNKIFEKLGLDDSMCVHERTVPDHLLDEYDVPLI